MEIVRNLIENGNRATEQQTANVKRAFQDVFKLDFDTPIGQAYVNGSPKSSFCGKYFF